MLVRRTLRVRAMPQTKAYLSEGRWMGPLSTKFRAVRLSYQENNMLGRILRHRKRIHGLLRIFKALAMLK